MLSFVTCCHHLFTYVAMVVHFDFQSRLGIKINLTMNTNKQAEREREKKTNKVEPSVWKEELPEQQQKQQKDF